jgi:hypothetical protein
VIARVWSGVVPHDKADAYRDYLLRSEHGVGDYERTPGNRGAWLLADSRGDGVHFVLLSFWESRAAIARYAGPKIDAARYFPFDRECLVDPAPFVSHYEVLVP